MCIRDRATSLNNAYPHAYRSRNLYNMVIKGMKNTRTPRQQTMEIPEDKIKEALSLIHISMHQAYLFSADGIDMPDALAGLAASAALAVSDIPSALYNEL